jgi:SAM-dependent methyltransferase
MITKQDIDNGKAFDWGQTSADYAKYRDIYPEAFYRKIAELGLCVSGQNVLDLGTGTGVLPRQMARYGAKFIGADISENQIAEARRLSREAGLDIRYVVSSAEDISFPDRYFDVVTACQCFMYFDKTVVLPKVHRILKDGGHFCVLLMAWLPDESEIAKHSEELVLKYNPFWTGGGFKRYKPEAPEWSRELFSAEHILAYDLDVAFTRDSWHGRIKACRGIGASSLKPEELEAFEKEHSDYLKTVPGVFLIPHYVTILNLRKRSA